MTTQLEQYSSDALLRHEEAAQYLRVNPGTLRLSRHTGELYKHVSTPVYIKLGHEVRYRRSTLDQWLAALPEFKNTADHKSSR